MTTTLDKYHDELDEALADVQLQIEHMAENAIWGLEEMYWEPRPPQVGPTYRSYEEQRKLWERWNAVKNILFPGENRHVVGTSLFALRDSMAVKHLFPTPHDHIDPRLLAYPGIAGQRILGNEPWHFEFTAPKLPWWKRTGLYRVVKRYRLMRTYGASKRKALGVKIWPRQSGKASR